MGTKGDWKRPIDKRYEEEAEKNQEKVFGSKCRLPHKHDEECQKKEEK